MTGPSLENILTTLAGRLCASGLMLVTVESCTGGGVAAAATSMAGSSDWFDRAWVTYSNEAKNQMVGVPTALIEEHGAVSGPVARAMAEGALQRCPAGRVAVSLTGIAGPAGGNAEKPVGTVYIAWANLGRSQVQRFQFDGDRDQVRRASAQAALSGLLEIIP